MQKSTDILKDPNSAPFLAAAMSVFLNLVPISQLDNRTHIEILFGYGWAFSAVLTDELAEFVRDGVPDTYLGPYSQEATVNIFGILLQELGYTEEEVTQMTTATKPHIFQSAFASGMDCGLKFIEYYVEHA